MAGGLQAGNVAAALATEQPFWLNLCSSVRVAGRLDAARLAAFFATMPAGPVSPPDSPLG